LGFWGVIMKYFDPANLTFNQIKVFLCLAETGSFSAVAKKLSYSQSMISKIVAGLEKELGLILFIRGQNGNVLTPAGKSLYNDWVKIFSDVEKSVQKAHITQSGMSSVLTIGNVAIMTECDEIIKTIREFCGRNPNVMLQYDEYWMSEIIELSRQHSLDIVITAIHEAPSLEECGYRWKIILESHYAVFVHKSNPISEREEITLADLSSEEFIVLSPSNHPNYIKSLTNLCGASGFTPKISIYVSNEKSQIMNLLNNRGVVFADSYAKLQHEEIKMFVLKDQPSGIIMAWPDKDCNLNVAKFISVVDEIMPI